MRITPEDDDELIDEYLDYVLDILRPQLDGRPSLTAKQYRVLQNEMRDFIAAIREKP